MDGEVIKSFLVGLGFGVDDNSLAKFNKAILSASIRVTALYASVKLAAAGIFASISSISEGFEKMGYEYRIIAPMISKALMLRQALLAAYRAAGINIVKAVQQSVLFNFSLAKTKFALEAIYRSVGLKFLPLLTKQMDIFRTKIYANMPKIQSALEKMVAFIFKAFEVTNILGERLWSILTRVWDFFVKLDTATNGWSTAILAALAAWRYLNLAFLATPIGALLTGFVALLALWDDFKTFQEGGQSLINWGSQATKVFVGIAGAVVAVGAAIAGLILAMKAYAIVQGIVNVLLLLNPFGLVLAGIVALSGVILILISNWGKLKATFGDIAGFFAGIGGKILGFAGGATQGPIGGVAQPAPLLPHGGTNQRVQQETNINVIGGADAQATGKAVAGEQGRVNGDLVRNLNPRAR